MRITEFHVTRYGPIGYVSPFALSDFTLFWGKNEQGKTLTIDALVKLLLGKEAKRFDKINRVEGQPSGHAVVAVDGERVKLSEKKTLTDVCGLSEAECRNVFIVRASDLSIGGEERSKEAEFYTSVSDRLTGMETQRIGRIRDSLLSLARITRTGDFRNIKDEKLKSRLESAAALSDEIVPQVKEVRAAGFDELESRQIGAAELIERIDHEIAELEDARKRAKFESGRDALAKLADSRKLLKELNRYREEDEQKWRDAEREISTQKEEIKRIGERQDSLREDLSKTDKLLDQKEREFGIIDERKKRLDEQIRPDLKNFEIRSGEITRRGGAKWLLTAAFVVLALTACASLFGIVLHPHPLFIGAALLLGVGAVVCFVLLMILSRQQAWLSGSLERIRLSLARFDLSGGTVAEINRNIQRFDEIYRTQAQELEAIRRKKGIAEGMIAENESKVPRYELMIRAAEEVIAQIQRASRCETIDELGQKISLKLDTIEIAREQVKVIEGGFEKIGGSLDEQISAWEQQVRSLSPYGEKGRGVDFSERVYKQKQDEKKAAVDGLTEITQRLADFKKGLERVERQANEILQAGDNRIFCETAADLASVKERLASFISEHEADRTTALTAVEIFEQIEQEEKGRVSLLFDEGGGVSGYFSTITGGLYDTVSFDPVGGVVSVRKGDGQTLSADKLSSGAYDQLYLAVRLALGRRIAPDGTGFFIMDDPFIRSDPDRLARQMAMLGDIARKGWQVVYFSSKGEVKEALAKEIKKGAVTLIDI
jgi:exonuclease SbcC